MTASQGLLVAIRKVSRCRVPDLYLSSQATRRPKALSETMLAKTRTIDMATSPDLKTCRHAGPHISGANDNVAELGPLLLPAAWPAQAIFSRQASAEHFQQRAEFLLLRNRGFGALAVTVLPVPLARRAAATASAAVHRQCAAACRRNTAARKYGRRFRKVAQDDREGEGEDGEAGSGAGPAARRVAWGRRRWRGRQLRRPLQRLG